MEGQHFDTLVQRMNRTGTRRAALALVAGSLGFSSLATRDTDAKKKKSKTHRCKTAGGVTITCPKKRVCCDPRKSTGAGCAPAGYPVCCESDGFAHRGNIVCCETSDEGADGICETGYPHCCPAEIGGCCERGFPVCCSNGVDEYCCPVDSICCDTDPTGCCVAEPARRAREGSMARGAWKARPADDDHGAFAAG